MRCSDPDSDYAPGHESATRDEIARRIAGLKGYDFAAEYDAAKDYSGRLYFVPSHTLIGFDAARNLGISSEEDLFGGVVPYSFAATKSITHPLVDEHAFAPHGWSYRLGKRIEDCVLFGFSAFSGEDARRAAAIVLDRGMARVKPACGVGGRGQSVIRTLDELDTALGGIDPHALSRDGVVIEENCTAVTTYSVGQVHVADLSASYYGTQRLTHDNRGVEVYGGSELFVVRGDYDALLALELAPEVRTAVAQARGYEAAAREEFRGLLASRRNYDIASAVDAAGRRRSGVLEQSWRIGGATPAEIMALEAFRADATLTAVRAACTELYGADHTPPANATVHFHGVDDRVGPVLKYTVVQTYGNS